MTEERLKEIEACVAAVPGPFRAEDSEWSWDLYAEPEPNFHGLKILKAHKQGCEQAEYWPNKAEADFLVNSWQNITDLLAEVRRLQEYEWMYKELSK